MGFTLSPDQAFFIMASTIVQEPSTILVLHTCTSSVSKWLCLVTVTHTVLFRRVVSIISVISRFQATTRTPQFICELLGSFTYWLSFWKAGVSLFLFCATLIHRGCGNKPFLNILLFIPPLFILLDLSHSTDRCWQKSCGIKMAGFWCGIAVTDQRKIIIVSASIPLIFSSSSYPVSLSQDFQWVMSDAYRHLFSYFFKKIRS